MAFPESTHNHALAWAGIFLCAVLAQIPPADKQVEKNTLSESQTNLLQNAVIPIYLSENRSASIRQLESLIQETDIRQIRIYTSDQQLLAQVLNAAAPENFRETQIENMPMVFQGSMAGSVQLDIAYATPDSKTFENVLAIVSKSLLITFLAWVLTVLYRSTCKWLLPKLHTKTREPGVLEHPAVPQQYAQGSSLLLYIYPLPERSLSEKPDIKRDCLNSFSRKLENHLRIYGGRILSVSEERLVCRMTVGQSQNDLQQALTFSWGIARPMLYRHEEQQFHLGIKSLLHKTEIPAKSGSLFNALSEVSKDMEKAVQNSPQDAHITEQLLAALNSSSNFDHRKHKDHSGIHSILSVKKSVDALWRKQEAMVSSTSA